MKVLATVEEFVEACKSLDNNEIYELFETDISQELRDKIYSFARDDSSEPCRDALNTLGTKYNVQSLIDY